MKICQIGSHNPYTYHLVNELSNSFESSAIILKSSKVEVSKYYNKDVNLVELCKDRSQDLLKLPKLIKKLEPNIDCFIFHYLNPYFALILASGIIKIPITYFCYGGDIHKNGLRKQLVKKALKNVDLIFAESPTEKQLLINEYGVDPASVCDVVWYPLDSVFESVREDENDSVDNFRDRWGISKKTIIFSPRGLIPYYNHHLLLEGIARSEHRHKFQVIFTGYAANSNYCVKLKDYANKHDIDCVFLDCWLTPLEMKELYLLSSINVNIPKDDGIGRSIIEGIVCNTLPFLNSHVRVYHDFFSDKKDCIFVEPNSASIANGINYFVEYHEIVKNIIVNSKKIVPMYFNWEKNSRIVRDRIEVICNKYK